VAAGDRPVAVAGQPRDPDLARASCLRCYKHIFDYSKHLQKNEEKNRLARARQQMTKKIKKDFDQAKAKQNGCPVLGNCS